MNDNHSNPKAALSVSRKRASIILISLYISAAVCFLLPGQALAIEAGSSSPTGEIIVPDSRNQIIKLSDKGIEPPVLEMKREDSIVFFLNQSKDSLATIEIDFKDKHTHCSSGNMSIIGGGKISSLRPFGPNDFSTTCFHDPGSYTFIVYGLKAKPEGIKGTILVK
ncbi:MAG: hypothetical protein J5J00_09555 [Deltaproteobacteria bacterium]|nr:hypothetical protein [Deltaproteobacteria bacterium]